MDIARRIVVISGIISIAACAFSPLDFIFIGIYLMIFAYCFWNVVISPKAEMKSSAITFVIATIVLITCWTIPDLY